MSDSGFDIYDDDSWAVPNVSQDDLPPVPEAWEPETAVEEAPLQAQPDDVQTPADEPEESEVVSDPFGPSRP